MIILGYTRTYFQGRLLAKEKGYDFAYVVKSNEYNRWGGCSFCVMV